MAARARTELVIGSWRDRASPLHSLFLVILSAAVSLLAHLPFNNNAY